MAEATSSGSASAAGAATAAFTFAGLVRESSALAVLRAGLAVGVVVAAAALSVGVVAFLDGAAVRAACGEGTFSPCLLNHSPAPNVVRRLDRAALECEFFLATDVGEGEELCFNYGAGYWRGREAEVVASV